MSRHFNIRDQKRNQCMLTGPFKRQGYDWWWHNFTAVSETTGKEQTFFIEFFVCNPALGGSQPVLGQLPENKAAGKKPSYLMVKAGTWGKEHKKQLHRFFSWEEAEVAYGTPYRVQGGDCLATEYVLEGSVKISEAEAAAHPEWMCDAGEMRWELQVDKQIAFNVGYGASTFFRMIKAFEMYWHAEGMKTAYSGTVFLDGERYTVKPETCYGYADKNWGRNFTSPWVWLSSNHMVSMLTEKALTNSVFDIGGGCPKIYMLPLKRKLLGAFWYEGQAYEYNFSKFWTLPKTRFDCEETETEIRWNIVQENRTSIMHTIVHCKKEDMLMVNYEAPDGSKRHNRLWNGGTGKGRIRLYKKVGFSKKLIDDILVYNIGCEYGEYDQ